MSSPTGSPFADVIQSLAGLHQEHHQALLDMREDQERRFCALVQNQQEDRELFRSWIDQEVRAGGIPTAPAPPTHMPVQKMGPQDDLEAFLDLFEKTADACGWAQTDWPVRLIPLLTGEAQLAAQQLPVQNLLVYDDLKRVILQQVGRSPEQHRQRFRSLELGENGRPFAMAHQLRDACRRWLLAGEGGVEQIIDRVVLEQFIARLPKKTAQWVQCHHPASLDLAIQLAEDQMVACHGVGETLPSVFSLSPSPSYPYFAILKDRLYRVTQDAQSNQDTTQLLVPKSHREMLFQAAHCNPMAGHLGQATTLNHLMARFFWPGIHENVCRWCAACRECQLVNPPASPKAPLRPLPLMQVPFERIGMDLIGLLERSARGHRFALVLVDYATRYPEAVALRNISAKSVAEALFSMISQVGIPKEILTDQGTAFMSRTIRELYGLLGIKSVRTSVYHPQTDGLVERFNRTLKSMIRKFVHEDAKKLGQVAGTLLFAVREVPQASTGFSPFELLYGRQPRGVLDVLRETWEEGPSGSKNEIQHVLDLRIKFHTQWQLSMENLLRAQDKQSRLYNLGARLRNFTPGDKVLVLLPTSSSKLLAKCDKDRSRSHGR